MSQPDSRQAQQLLTALERIIASPEEIIAQVHKLKEQVGDDIDKVAPRVIAYYSNRAALGGGATALPAMLPGIGTVTTFLAGPLADMVLLLKWETEMCLALSAARGYDIHDPRERQLAFLLAAVSTAAVAKRNNVVLDATVVSSAAIWNYTPRRIGKALITSMAVVGALLIARTPQRALLAIPFLGVGVGAVVNKWLTGRIGRQANAELVIRRRLDREAADRDLLNESQPKALNA